MPKKLLKRWIPDPEKIKRQPGLHLLGSLLDDPNLFHLNRHSVSVAFFVGLFCTFVPLPGQMVLAAFMAFVLRSNLPISVGLVWISNPITIPPIFYACYRLGVWMLQAPELEFSIELSWAWVCDEFPKLWIPLITGSLFCAVFFGCLGYLFIQGFWRWHVVSNWEKRKIARRKAKKPSA